MSKSFKRTFFFLLSSSAAVMSAYADTWTRYVREFNRTDRESYTNTIANAQAEKFLRENAPAFECPDADIERTYHFRWWTFRKHLKHTDDGWVVTEFLPPVGWARRHNTISCALGHHCREGRWLRDRKYVSDYLRFMLRQGTVSGKGAYINWPAVSILALSETTGDSGLGEQLLPDLVRHYRTWEKGWSVRAWPYKGEVRIGLDPCGMFSMSANYEGSEFAIGGNGYRPLINSCMAAEARAISEIARCKGDVVLAEEFAAKASGLEKIVSEKLWNSDRIFYTTVSTTGTHTVTRELNGYAPWYFGFARKGRGAAWNQLLDENGFFAPWGLTFPERRDPAFKIDYNGHCCLWNGPVWPYSTSVALTGLANAIADGESGKVSADDYVRLLRQYAKSHVLKLEDGSVVPWIDENMNPFDGDWIARTILKKQGDRIPDRGKDYNHSTFCDLVISGLVGLSSPGHGVVEIRPLAPEGWDWWRLSGVPCAGMTVDVVWDRNGRRFGKGKGFSVFADGKAVFTAPTVPRMKRIRVKDDALPWTAPLSAGAEAFNVEMIDGAEGSVSFENGEIEIVKSNSVGSIIVSLKEGPVFPVGSNLRVSADVSVKDTEGEYSLGFLRLWGASRRLHAIPQLDGGAFFGGGPKMAWMHNTRPRRYDTRFSRFNIRTEADRQVTPAIVITGLSSRSRWKNLVVRDFDVTCKDWKLVQKRHSVPNHLHERIGRKALAARLEKDIDHTAKVMGRDGKTVLLVDGKETPPVLYLGPNMCSRENDSFNGRRMAEAGVGIQAIRVWFGDARHNHLARWTADGFDLAGAVEDVRKRMEMSPDALYVLQLRVSPYPEFTQRYPDERWIDARGQPVRGNTAATVSGTNGWPWASMYSKVWRDEVKKHTGALIDELKKEGLARKIVGIHFCGFMDAQFAPAVPDYGKPALAAWNRPVPVIGKRQFFDPAKDREAVDFAVFQHVAPFRVQEDLARFAKARFGKDIIAVHWTLGVFAGEFCASYYLSEFLKSDVIDVAVSQTSYPRRLPGMALGNPAPIASFHRHGKLYFNELDLRTYGHLEPYYSEVASVGVGCARDYGDWRSAHLKMAGWCFANRAGYWYYDLGGGFFEPREITADIADAMAYAPRVYMSKKTSPWEPSVSLVVDEKGMLLRNYFAESRDKGTSSLVREQLHLMSASGVPFDVRLMDDVLEDPRVLSRRNVVVLAGAFALDRKRRALLDSLLADGKTVICLAGTGFADGAFAAYGFDSVLRKTGASHALRAEDGEDPEQYGNYLDTQYRRWGLGVKTGWAYDFYHPWSIGFNDDPQLKVYARYADDAKIAIAEKSVGKGRVLAIGDCAGLTPEFFNRQVRMSGGYVPAGFGLQVDMNGDFASVHCLRTGRYEFATPCGRVIPLDMKAGDSRWLDFASGSDADRNGRILAYAAGRPCEPQAPRDILCNHPDYVCFVPRNNRKFPGDTADPTKRGDSYNDHFQVIHDPVRRMFYAFWTQATKESALDQHIAFSRSSDGGITWSEPVVIAGSETRANPTGRASWQQPMLTRRGRLYCLWNQSINGSRPHYGMPYGRYSDDGGASWSDPEPLADFKRMDADGVDASKSPCWCNWQRPLRLAENGKFFVGCSRFGRAPYDKGQRGKVEFWRFENVDAHPEVRDIRISQFAINRSALGAEDVVEVPGFRFFSPHPRSDGKTPYPSLEEASVVKLPDGRLFALMRSTLGCPVWSQSRDGGETWEKPRALLDENGKPFLHSCSPCPMYDWKGCEAGSGIYFTLLHDRFDFNAPSAYQKRGALYLHAGRFDPDGEQPVRFGKGRLFAPRAANNSSYASYTVVDGEGVLWAPDQKYYLIGRKIGPEWFGTNDKETRK